jgi:hypothetical protein
MHQNHAEALRSFLFSQAIRFENARRQRGKKVTFAFEQHMNETIADIQSRIILSHKASLPKLPPEVPTQPRCIMFNQIRNYLFKNRLELALDTVNGPMPEHTLFNDILNCGGLRLDADEGR